jgi:hypothetical protein
MESISAVPLFERCWFYWSHPKSPVKWNHREIDCANVVCSNQTAARQLISILSYWDVRIHIGGVVDSKIQLFFQNSLKDTQKTMEGVKVKAKKPE